MKTNKRLCVKGWQKKISVIAWGLLLVFPIQIKALELEEIEAVSIQIKALESKERELEWNDKSNNVEMIEEQVSMQENDFSLEVEEERNNILNQYSKDLKFINNEVQVYSQLGEITTVSNILDQIDWITLTKEYPLQEIYVVDEEGKKLREEDIVTDSVKLILLGDEILVSYTIQIVGDYNQDGIVNESDRDYVMENILENQENEYTIGDAGYIDYVIENNTYETPDIVPEVLEPTLEIEEKDIYVEQEIVVTYRMNNLEKNEITGMSGDIQYDHELLKLESVSLLVDGKIIGGVVENYFIYLFQSNVSSPILVARFRTLKEGYSNISFEKMKFVMNGTLLELDSNNKQTEINIQAYGKGGDDPIEPTEAPKFPNIPTESSTIEPTYPSYQITYITTKPESKSSSQIIPTENKTISSDTYIKNLEIKGYNISFDQDLYYYAIEVDETVNSLDLNVLLNDSNSSYVIEGNDHFQVGMNQVIIKVSAEDGSSKNYIIEVNKKEEKRQKEESQKQVSEIPKKKKDNQFLMTGGIIVLIVLLVVGLVYLFLREEN